MRVSFLVLAHNEAATIGEVQDRIAALEIDSQIIVVDTTAGGRRCTGARHTAVRRSLTARWRTSC